MTQPDDIKMVVTQDRQERQPITAPTRNWRFTNPKKAAYNKVYNKTSQGCLVNLLFLVSFGVLTFSIPSCDFKKSDKAGGSYRKITN
jgi:hypothetical protein